MTFVFNCYVTFFVWFQASLQTNLDWELVQGPNSHRNSLCKHCDTSQDVVCYEAAAFGISKAAALIVLQHQLDFNQHFNLGTLTSSV